MDQLATRISSWSKVSLAVFVLMVADMVALIGAMFLSLWLHYDSLFVQRMTAQIGRHLPSLPFVLLLYIGIFHAFRLYRYAWRFASIEMLWGVVSANSVGLLGLIILQALIDNSTFPRAVLIVHLLVSIVFVGGVRIVLRLANIGRSYGRDTLHVLRRDVQPKRVLILGAGVEAARLVAGLREDLGQAYEVVGFLDDTPTRWGIFIRGVKVLGPLHKLYELLARRAVDEVLILIPGASGAAIREYVMACRRRQVPVKVVPGLSDVLHGRARLQLEEFSVEDLLRRPPVWVDVAEIGGYVTGKRVLVTGAGGSIGSELCRQISALAPASLTLLGHGENSIHRISQELLCANPALADSLSVVIGSVADGVRADQVFDACRPEVVFHAAAHKHVPIMEMNVEEAVQNNVMGTFRVAEACGRYQVERMVLISTDKAVNPSSVMGATKWLCEEVARAAAITYPETTSVVVRFGNVLGSRGSVVELFRDQIQRGGPVTVTHPEMTRYFMTIPEAVQLVLQAGAIGRSGELFLLDMGQPVNILELARDMIRLSGLEPDVDIPIVFTGLRPGEKLHESLATEEEDISHASSQGLWVVRRPQYFAPAELREVLQRMQYLSTSGDTEKLLAFLGDTVPAFSHRTVPADGKSAASAISVSATS